MGWQTDSTDHLIEQSVLDQEAAEHAAKRLMGEGWPVIKAWLDVEAELVGARLAETERRLAALEAKYPAIRAAGAILDERQAGR